MKGTILLWLAAWWVPILEAGGGDRTVYRETFGNYADPARYLRIAQAVERWELVRGPEGTFLRVHAYPTTERAEFLVVWDLVPLQFRRLSVQIRPNFSAPDGALRLVANLEDRTGVAYAGRPAGATKDGAEGGPLLPGEWNTYNLDLPRDLGGASRDGRALLSAAGEPLEDGPDFANVGYRTIYFNFRLPPDSPLLGKPLTVDLRELTMSETVP